MRATIEVLSELEGQNLERIIEMAQDMIRDILRFGELGAESGYIAKYCNVPPEDIRGIIEKITERWRSEFNASNTNAPFDENSGWYVGPLAVRIAAAVDRDGFTSRLKEAIGEWPG